jgi:uncharacterized membrane-anchored protein
MPASPPAGPSAATVYSIRPEPIWRRAGHPVKVPERITPVFWVIKVLGTGMGEALADFVALRYSPLAAGIVGVLVFVTAMSWQLATRRYSAWAYWAAVSSVAVFGTLGADGLHIEFGVPYLATTIFFGLALAVILRVWYRREGTLSIHSITTPRRELFYWATVLATFALGTALGDLTATTFHLGYFSSGLLFLGLFLLPGAAWWRWQVNDVVAFWAAYILTRPLGASFADWMGVAQRYGGLGMGRGAVALMLAVPIVLLVGYVATAQPDIVRRRGSGQPVAVLPR